MKLPTIDQNSIISNLVHPIDQINTTSSVSKNKKIKKRSSQWHKDMKIISFSMPQINQSQTMIRKYKIKLMYKTPNGQKHPKTIFFGDDSDFVFNKDQNKRVRRLLSMKHLDNPLHPNYWKALLLNKYQTMQQGLKQFTQYFLQSQKKQLENKVSKVGKMPALNANGISKMIV